ncbi:hypothetical protein [Kitasatospora purpeofusca]|uniref:hypothetical protein n=1 Tax=Kitasatospora purpeofusca TaxID=67352 RepID=UPI003F4AAB74
MDFFVPAELAGLESLCRADLGQHDRAVAGAEQAVMLFADGHPRNRALYTADIALHHTTDAGPHTLARLECQHRMACARCDFYTPNASSKASCWRQRRTCRRCSWPSH